jgi:hypothetical protein
LLATTMQVRQQCPLLKAPSPDHRVTQPMQPPSMRVATARTMHDALMAAPRVIAGCGFAASTVPRGDARQATAWAVVIERSHCGGCAHGRFRNPR